MKTIPHILLYGFMVLVMESVFVDLLQAQAGQTTQVRPQQKIMQKIQTNHPHAKTNGASARSSAQAQRSSKISTGSSGGQLAKTFMQAVQNVLLVDKNKDIEKYNAQAKIAIKAFKKMRNEQQKSPNLTEQQSSDVLNHANQLFGAMTKDEAIKLGFDDDSAINSKNDVVIQKKCACGNCAPFGCCACPPCHNCKCGCYANLYCKACNCSCGSTAGVCNICPPSCGTFGANCNKSDLSGCCPGLYCLETVNANRVSIAQCVSPQ